MILDEDDDRRVLAGVLDAVTGRAAGRPAARLQRHGRAASPTKMVGSMPSGQRDRSQGHGGLVAAEPPPDRTQVLPGALCLVPAGLDRDDAASTRHPDERGRGSLEIARGLFPRPATNGAGRGIDLTFSSESVTVPAASSTYENSHEPKAGNTPPTKPGAPNGAAA